MARQITNAKPRDMLKTLASFRTYMGHHKYALFGVALLVIVSTGVNLWGTFQIRTVVNKYILPGDYQGLVHFIIFMGIVYAIGATSTAIYKQLMIHTSQKIVKEMRQDLFDRMQKLPIKYFDSHTHGEIMSHFTNDLDTVQDAFNNCFDNLIQSFIMIVGTLILIFVLSWQLSLIVLFCMIIMYFVIQYLSKRSKYYFSHQQAAMGNLNGFIEEMVDGVKVVKVFNHEEKAIEDFRNINNDLRNSAYKANKFANILMPVTIQIGNFSYIICAVIGAILSISGVVGITIGTLVSFLTLNKNFNQPIGQISQQINSVAMAQAGAKRIFDLLDQKSEDDQGIVTLCRVEYVDGQMQETLKRTGHWAWRHPRTNGEIELVEMKGDIRLENVDFGYFDDCMVLHDLNVFAAPGEKIAFVGATGAGKTTITNLINRFYDIQKGTITYDGIDIKLIKKDDLRKSLGVVLQDTHLFTGTIMDNIRYGRLDATDEEMEKACQLAYADHFINTLEDGYDTVINEESNNISQGQKQLLTIARAFLADPKILILDEATSSVDTRTEVLIQKGMDKLMEGRTSFIIAHRLSTIRDANTIIVMRDGDIVELGNHESLLAKGGFYADLYHSQFESSKEDE